MDKYFITFAFILLTSIPAWTNPPLHKNPQELYWYGVAVLLGMGSMFGLVITLASLYTNKLWLNKLATILGGWINILLGLGGIVVYLQHSEVGWVAFLPMATAIIGSLMLLSKQRALEEKVSPQSTVDSP